MKIQNHIPNSVIPDEIQTETFIEVVDYNPTTSVLYYKLKKQILLNGRDSSWGPTGKSEIFMSNTLNKDQIYVTPLKNSEYVKKDSFSKGQIIVLQDSTVNKNSLYAPRILNEFTKTSGFNEKYFPDTGALSQRVFSRENITDYYSLYQASADERNFTDRSSIPEIKVTEVKSSTLVKKQTPQTTEVKELTGVEEISIPSVDITKGIYPFKSSSESPLFNKPLFTDPSDSDFKSRSEISFKKPPTQTTQTKTITHPITKSNTQISQPIADIDKKLSEPVKKLVPTHTPRTKFPSQVKASRGSVDPIKIFDYSSAFVTNAEGREILPPKAVIFPTPQVSSIYPDDIAFILGYTDLTIEVENIAVSKNQNIESIPLLRSRGSIKKGLGHSTDVVTISLTFPDKDSNIKLSSLVKQIRKCPFLPVRCQRLAEEEIDALSVVSISASTVEAFPYQHSVVITAVRFDWRQYFPDDSSERFADLFSWPVFKYWCEDSIDMTYLGKPDELVFYTIKPEYLKELTKLNSNKESSAFVSEAVLSDTTRAQKTLDKFTQEKLTPGNLQPNFKDSSGKLFYEFKPETLWSLQKALPFVNKIDPVSSESSSITAKSGIYITQGNVTLKKLKYLFTLDPRVNTQFVLSYYNGPELTDYNQAVETFVKRVSEGMNTSSVIVAPEEYTFYISQDCPFWNVLINQAKKFTPIKIGNSTIGVKTELKTDIWKTWDFSDAIEHITCSYSNTFSFQQASDQQYPKTQYLGGSEVQFQMLGTFTDISQASLFKSLWDEMLDSARNSYHEGLGVHFKGFVKVSNSVTKMFGVDHIIVNQYEVSTIPQLPNDLAFSINFVEYDPSLSKRENLNSALSLRTYTPENLESTTDSIQRIIAQNNLDQKLKRLDVYPDLGLPTYRQLNEIIRNIKNKSEKARKNIPEYIDSLAVLPYISNFSEGKQEYGFADPEFFVISPMTLSQEQRKRISNYWRKNSSDVAYTSSDGSKILLQGQEELTTIEKLRLDNSKRDVPGLDGKTSKEILDYYKKIQAISPGFVDVINSSYMQGVGPTLVNSNTSFSVSSITSNNNIGFIGPKTDTELTQYRSKLLTDTKTTTVYNKVVELINDIQITKLPFMSEVTKPENNTIRWETIAIDQGIKARIDPAYILAVIQTESSGNPLDTTGLYRGLTNIGGDEVPEILNKDFKTTVTAKDLYNPSKNITFYTTLINYLISNKRKNKLNLASRNVGFISELHNAGPNTNPLNATQHTEKYNNYRRVTARYIMYRAYYLRNALAEQKALYPNLDALVLADKYAELQYFWTKLKEGVDPLQLSFNIHDGLDIKYITIRDFVVASKVVPAVLTSLGSTPISQPNKIKNPHQHLNNPFEDHEKYDVRNTLKEAYPAYVVLLINGGRWVGLHRVFDLLYGHTGVSEIEVFKTREDPVNIATVTFSNMYRKLTNSLAETDLANRVAERRWSLPLFGLGEQIVNLFNPDITEDMLIYRNQLLNSLNLRAGSRLHLRVGYGSDPSQWPPLFNGTISEVPSDDHMVKVIALGDGQELTNDIPFGTPQENREGVVTELTAFAGGGKDPRVIVSELFITVSDNPLGTAIDNISKGKYVHNNLYGIENFGRPNYPNLSFDSLFQGVKEGETGVNLYEPNDIGENQTTALSNVFGWIHSNSTVMTSISVENGTPWKVIDIARKASPDFIAQVVPFGLRSTLFFGRLGWDYYYDYDFQKFQDTLAQEVKSKQGWNDLLTAAEIGTLSAPLPFLSSYSPGDLTMWLYLNKPSFFMKRKTFGQYRIAASSHNILENKIVATDENMWNMVQTTEIAEPLLGARRDRGSSTKFFDINVLTERKKLKTVSSGLLCKAFNTGREALNVPLKSVDDGIRNAFGGSILNQSSSGNEVFAVSTLVEGMQLMYDGHVLLKGDSSLIPTNHMCLYDFHKQMNGIFHIRSVTHTFNIDSGFTTSVVPDLAVTGTDTETVSKWLAALRWSSSAALGYYSVPMLIEASKHLLIRGKTRADIVNTLGDDLRYLAEIKELSPSEYRLALKQLKESAKVINNKTPLKDVKRLVLDDIAASSNPIAQKITQVYSKNRFAISVANRTQGYKNTVNTLFTVGKNVLNKTNAVSTATKVGQAVEKVSPTATAKATELSSQVATKASSSAQVVKTIGQEVISHPQLGTLMTKVGGVALKAANIVGLVLGVVLTNNVSELIERKLSSRQSCIAFPLRLKGKEFSAGIEGHKGGVVGDPTDVVTATLRSFVSPGDAAYDLFSSKDPIRGTGNVLKTTFASLVFALGVDISSGTTRSVEDEQEAIGKLNDFYKQ